MDAMEESFVDEQRPSLAIELSRTTAYFESSTLHSRFVARQPFWYRECKLCFVSAIPCVEC